MESLPARLLIFPGRLVIRLVGIAAIARVVHVVAVSGLLRFGRSALGLIFR